MASLPHAESSNATEIRTQTQVHEFLQFTDLRHFSKSLTLRRIRVDTINGIDWNELEIFDPDNQMARLLPPGSPWRRFFDILEPSYDELVYEFWSSFHYTGITDLTHPSITFRLCGQTFKMSLTQFALFLGIYTEEEVRMPIFTKALTKYPYDIQAYWRRHSPAAWCKNNDAKTLTNHLYQYMHRVLANTVRGRSSNHRRVSSTDLFHLYSIFESVPCNIAHALASYFEFYNTRPPKTLMGGSYITRIAKSLDVLNDQIILGLSAPKAPGFVSFSKPTPIHVPIQFSPSEIPSAIPEKTPPQNLQQLMSQLPRPSFYRHDLLSQQQSSPIFEHIPTNPSQAHHTQPQTPSVFQSLSPLSFGQEIGQQSLYDEDMLHQDFLTQDQPLLPLLQQHSPQHQSNHPEQQQPLIIESGPSTMPPINPPLDPMELAMTKLIKQKYKMSRQIEWLILRNKWQEEMLKQVANIIQIQFTPPPPSPHVSESDSEFDSDSEYD